MILARLMRLTSGYDDLEHLVERLLGWRRGRGSEMVQGSFGGGGVRYRLK